MRKVRTSTKLLILIVIGVFASIVIFDLLAKQQFENGKFAYFEHQKTDTDVYTITNLPASRHIVINSILKAHDGSLITDGIRSWRPRLMVIEDTTIQSPVVDIPRALDNSVIVKVVNDTLHIAFDTKRSLDGNEMISIFKFDYIKIRAPRVSSLIVVNGYVYMRGNFDNTDAYLSHTILSLDSAQFNTLNIRGEDASKLKIDYESKIRHLQYDLCHSSVFIAKGNVGKFTKGDVDAASFVNIVDTAGNSTRLPR